MITSPLLRRTLVGGAAFLALSIALDTQAAAPTVAPQVLLAITNSESMDGSTSGAIMVGSGSLGSSFSSLTASSSPTSYTIPAGFTPPVNAGTGGVAPYTAACGSNQCDNSQSRLNMTKAAIAQVLTTYGSSLNFGLYTYSTSNAAVYETWVYYMSQNGGFTFTNTAPAAGVTNVVANPCFGYSTAPSAVKNACSAISGQFGTTLATSKYMNIGASSDDTQINDVLYVPNAGIQPDMLTYGTVTPANPYSGSGSYSLPTYVNQNGNFRETYNNTLPVYGSGSWTTTPTNAGYVPFSTQVLYSARGFGYGGSQDPANGSAKVAMGTDPSTSTAFTLALAPETNSTSTPEIKSVAGQSSVYGLLNGAKGYLTNLNPAPCQSQYVVMLTDGLPTMDKVGGIWPPLGTATANAYNLTATFNADGSFIASNSQAVTDAITAITALNGAGIKTYVIGLGAGVDSAVNPIAAKVLQAMAIAGGTAYFFPATDSASLNNAFLSIVTQIYSSTSVSAPLAPLSVAGGASFEYELTSVPNPAEGHVSAYAVAASGAVSGTPAWDAAALMSAANRTTALVAAKTDNTFATLSNVEPAAWNLTPTTCVPNIATIVSYTINPSVSGVCSYLAGRKPNAFLGSFSTQSSGQFVGPPAAALLVAKYPTYTAYSRAQANRTPMLVFSNNDGFLYSVTASTGQLRWGWTSRNLLSKMQNYATFAGSDATDGGFSVIDAMDGSGTWGSYVVGSLQSGAEHFVFKLAADGSPVTAIYDNVIANGSSAGDKASTIGGAPLRQAPVVAYIGNTAYLVYVVTVGSTSTLYETNIATGITTSAALSGQVSSALFLNAASNQLWFGGSNGSLWNIILSSGSATSDITHLVRASTLTSPANGAVVTNPLYLGYYESSGVPRFYALSASEIETFDVTAGGWTPQWAATTSSSYTYNPTTQAWTVVPGGTTLTANSVVSDAPIVISGALLVPAYVAGTGCSLGTGYYDFFNIATGAFPSNLPLVLVNSNGTTTPITGNISIGSGGAFTPTVEIVAGGIQVNPQTTNQTTPPPPLHGPRNLNAWPMGWRQH